MDGLSRVFFGVSTTHVVAQNRDRRLCAQISPDFTTFGLRNPILSADQSVGSWELYYRRYNKIGWPSMVKVFLDNLMHAIPDIPTLIFPVIIPWKTLLEYLLTPCGILPQRISLPPQSLQFST